MFIFTSGVFVRKFLCTAGTDHDAGMGLSVSASRGAGDRAGTIARMCLSLMFLVTAARNRLAFLERFGAPISLRAGGQLTGREGADVAETYIRGPAPYSLVARGNWSGRLLSVVWENRACLLLFTLVTTLQLRPRRRHITRRSEGEVPVERGGRAL